MNSTQGSIYNFPSFEFGRLVTETVKLINKDVGINGGGGGRDYLRESQKHIHVCFQDQSVPHTQRHTLKMGVVAISPSDSFIRAGVLL